MQATHDQLESIAFVGETLGPLFLYEPFSPDVVGLYEALGTLDVDEAATEWPFVSDECARDALGKIARGIADDADSGLLWEYRRLFVGPALKAAPPWGSVYTDKDQVIFGRSTLALRQWMRENGIACIGSGADPEDHIGRMLLMMAWIAREKPECLDALLQDHLLTWAPHFLEYLEAQTALPFFAGLATITCATLLGIADELEIEVVKPRFYR